MFAVAFLPTAIVLFATTTHADETRTAIAEWKCFNPGDKTMPVVRAWFYDKHFVAHTDSDNKTLITEDNANARIEMNGITRLAGYATGAVGFSRQWIIPTFRFHDGSAPTKGLDFFTIQANSVGEYEVNGEIRFTVNCKRTL